MGKTGVIVLAAGRGTRMKSSVAKQFMEIKGRPLVFYALRAFEESEADHVILVTGEDSVEYCKTSIVKAYGFQKVVSVVAGGKERYHSVYEGLKALSDLGYGEEDIVLIHDGARPVITQEIIAASIRDTRLYGAAVTSVPVKDTIKIVDEEGFAVSTPARSTLRAVQTPQSFAFPLIFGAYTALFDADPESLHVTDDAMVVETMTDHRVKLTEGDFRNIKVTTPEDINMAETFLS